ncbi:MAG TPA: 5'-3' exonuclease H3TH domain-containing protein, partial [Polyangiaceae bacterium]|nr:5'-3' exonuclease H3TH domain-containing protein [Polyangiaceae bacterium]
MATELFPAGAADVLYLVDLSSYVLRAYHAVAPLSSPTGEPTHAVHGTVSMLERLLRERRPALFAIAMDSGRATFRKEIYAEYKAHRPPAPDDLKIQMNRLEQIVRAFQVPVLKTDRVEADDLIASCVRTARVEGLRVVIVAGDKDLMQLVGPDVIMYDTMRERVFGVAEVEERFGVRISQVRDYLALTGDSSDNIPGVPSVGPKTAKELLVAYGDLDGIYRQVEQVQRKALRETLQANREQAFLSQRLVTLKDDCDIEFTRERFSRGPRDVGTLRTIYSELGFQRQLTQLELESSSAPAAPADTDTGNEAADAGPAAASANAPAVAPPLAEPERYELVREPQQLLAFLNGARERGHVGVQLFTEGALASRGRLVGAAFCVEPGHAVYAPFAHRNLESGAQISLAEAKALLTPILGDPSIKKFGLDLKSSAVAAARANMNLEGFAFDAGIASYLLDPEAQHTREALAQRELGVVPTTYDELTRRARGKRVAFDELTPEEARVYAAACADFAVRLEARMAVRLSEEGL